ncbi:MAG: hypothetical protein GY820_05845 [Gammaproteobacteria bacterium]|nr:hypothetical protein [Gammaproteobacteria bacterium]
MAVLEKKLQQKNVHQGWVVLFQIESRYGQTDGILGSVVQGSEVGETTDINFSGFIP